MKSERTHHAECDAAAHSRHVGGVVMVCVDGSRSLRPPRRRSAAAAATHMLSLHRQLEELRMMVKMLLICGVRCNVSLLWCCGCGGGGGVCEEASR
jgi:hypothetical protein